MYVFVNCKCGVEAAEEVSMHSRWWGSSRSGFWSGQWMIKQAFAQHMRCSRSPTCICLLPQLFFWVLHLNLCTWNLRLCDPAGWCWVRSCAHRNWICVAFYSGRATFPQCCQSPHLRLGINIPSMYGGRRGCGDFLTTIMLLLSSHFHTTLQKTAPTSISANQGGAVNWNAWIQYNKQERKLNRTNNSIPKPPSSDWSLPLISYIYIHVFKDDDDDDNDPSIHTYTVRIYNTIHACIQQTAHHPTHESNAIIYVLYPAEPIDLNRIV